MTVCALCDRPIVEITGADERLEPFCPDADGCRRNAASSRSGAVREIERLERELGAWRLGTAEIGMEFVSRHTAGGSPGEYGFVPPSPGAGGAT